MTITDAASNIAWLWRAVQRATHLRARLRAVVGIYDQWPILIEGEAAWLPIGRLYDEDFRAGNDNRSQQ